VRAPQAGEIPRTGQIDPEAHVDARCVRLLIDEDTTCPRCHFCHLEFVRNVAGAGVHRKNLVPETFGKRIERRDRGAQIIHWVDKRGRSPAYLRFIDQGTGIGFTLFGSSQSFGVSQVPQLMPERLSAIFTSGSAWMVAPGVAMPS
jgi:hypothetical protein